MQFKEAEAVAALASARDRCVRGVLEFMAACGVRVTSAPPQLTELLTAYGFHAIGLGRALSHEEHPNPPGDQPDCERSDVVDALRGDPALRSDLGASSHDREPTRRVVRPAR